MLSPRRFGANFARILLTIGAAALFSGCRNLYFQAAGEPPAEASRHRLAAWPDREYWTGIVFNGDKIGFSHLALGPGEAPGTFELRSEAAFVLRFMGYTKQLNLKSYDLVREDLDLVEFHYEYLIDGNALSLDGKRRGGSLDVIARNGDRTTASSLAAAGRLYPQSAITLYPTFAGLVPGREFRYPVYSGELQKIAQVTQRVAAFERSTLFAGEAYRVETELEGYRVDTWISPRGAPLLEIGMNGVLISGLEDESRARAYLANASLNKSEALVEFAIVRLDRPLSRPRAAAMMKVALSGATRAVPSDEIQQCQRDGAETVCVVGSVDIASIPAVAPAAGGASGGSCATSGGIAGAGDPRYLATTLQVPVRDARIVTLAREIAGDATDQREQVQRIVTWIDRNILKSPADAWTALDVLQTREAECQGHTYLYAALARALGIPTRVVNGIVYSEDFGGFLYHTWAESLIAGRWLAVDPTFATIPADATHVKLVEGETPADLAPLVDWVGRLKLRVIAVEYRG